MARASYGPETKKRSRRLLEVLLVYANDEIVCRDDSILETLRLQIQTRWQSETRLVVRTKVRFLQLLTTLEAGKIQLNAEQIKEALKRFADFLEILEDNRPSRAGSETWHFTLKLWHNRQEIAANLQQFDQHWEHRRPEKSKQVASEDDQEHIMPSAPDLPQWEEICQANFARQNHQRLTTNPLTSIDGVSFELHQVYVPLGLVERQQRLQTDSHLSEPEAAEVSQIFAHAEFIQLLQRQQSRRIAIIGEPGAGKTTLLQKIATWVLAHTEDLVIWVDLADLQGKTIAQYLIQDWLPSALCKLRVPPEIEENFCEQFNQGRVWLILDAVDEMALESSQALGKIASYLQGWVADATILLTCRLNIWDAGKNALESFDTYRNLNFTDNDPHHGSNQIGEFIQRWFQNHPNLGESLQAQLNQVERRRLKHAVQNPLRLALLCRIWGLARGRLPHTKAMLYQQFVEAIYEWKQDRFPTTSTQRQQLNQALGQLALLAIAQEKTKFRLRHRFILEVLGNCDDDLWQLALQLGWLNQVGISATWGEKVYAFYHPTFQEYFAAQAVTDWRFFFNHTSGNEDSQFSVPSYRIFSSQWREVILLWLGRDDISQTKKDEFIQALIEFTDGCGGCYDYQAYFLAAQGIAEFADCRLADNIVQQLIKWRFGYFDVHQQKWWRYPAPIVEGARVALLKTDRPKAIAAFEQFIQSHQNAFNSWNAAYSLGKVFDPGNKIAIATLETLATTSRQESIRWQVAYNLGRVDPGNYTAIATLIEIITHCHHESIRRKAAYSLGKLDLGNAIAISTLEQLATSATDTSQRQQAAANLKMLYSPESFQVNQPPSLPASVLASPPRISSLVRGITAFTDEDTKRRRAYKLAQLDPGNSVALTTLLQLLKFSDRPSVCKRAADHLKEVILYEQIPQAIASLQDYFEHHHPSILEQHHDCYKLLWHCAETIEYPEFYQIWHHIYL
ncbi:NACHT domain-containing protein [Fortiea contorta]|uniref:NACHT domain-containing protein n=1 Tax=Fortiea contorta TaxID=1892405 RepID=UPI00034DA6DC|nr:HEAT repeat domain-containing protein [Fortiea contorta]